jgi:hypothetical protein
MGKEVACTIEIDGKGGRGRAHLASDSLDLRGPLSLHVPFKDVTNMVLDAGVLLLSIPRGFVALELGSSAVLWQKKIRSPPGLMDKLGVGSDATPVVLGVTDRALLGEFEARAKAVRKRLVPASRLVFCEMSALQDLRKLAALRKALAPEGALWIFWPKGRKEFREDDVRAAALASGLVDVKVASVSPVLSGLKLVIPVAMRGQKEKEKKERKKAR